MPLAYGGEREPAKQLHLGRIDVSVPRDHHSGNVERPSIWTFWREDPDKHFVIVKAAEQGYDEFYTQVREVVGHSSRKEAFVFVHGFNVTFESAVYRTAQIAYDLGFDGAPILYSWPSVGEADRLSSRRQQFRMDHRSPPLVSGRRRCQVWGELHSRHRAQPRELAADECLEKHRH